MNRLIIFIIFGISVHSHVSAASPECSEDIDVFLASPSKENYTTISKPEKMDCLNVTDRSSPELNYLLYSVSRGNSWAARYLINHIEKLDGGNLEDSLIALGEFAEHDMEKLLSFANEGILSENALRSITAMVTLSLSDNLKAQLNVLHARKYKVINVKQVRLSKERAVALESINKQIHIIESHVQEINRPIDAEPGSTLQVVP